MSREARLAEYEETAELVVVVGSGRSSLASGPAADLVTRLAGRAGPGGALGVVIIRSAVAFTHHMTVLVSSFVLILTHTLVPSCHPSQLDCCATLRLSPASCDAALSQLASCLQLQLSRPDTRRRIEHRAVLPYDGEGRPAPGTRMVVDLTPGQEVQKIYPNRKKYLCTAPARCGCTRTITGLGAGWRGRSTWGGGRGAAGGGRGRGRGGSSATPPHRSGDR